jgi:hypothetical protein
VSVYNGAIFAFINVWETSNFFQIWTSLWENLGGEREMPALSVASHLCKFDNDISIAHLPPNFFEPKIYNPAAIVQHWYGPQFSRRFKTAQKQKPKFACDNALNWKIVKW